MVTRPSPMERIRRIRNLLAELGYPATAITLAEAVAELREPEPEPVLDAGWPTQEMTR